MIPPRRHGGAANGSHCRSRVVLISRSADLQVSPAVSKNEQRKTNSVANFANSQPSRLAISAMPDRRGEEITPNATLWTMVGSLLRVRHGLETKGEFSAVRTDLQHVDARLTAEVRRVETTSKRRFVTSGIATRRHFAVVRESLRDDIRMHRRKSSSFTRLHKSNDPHLWLNLASIRRSFGPPCISRRYTHGDRCSP